MTKWSQTVLVLVVETPNDVVKLNRHADFTTRFSESERDQVTSRISELVARRMAGPLEKHQVVIGRASCRQLLDPEPTVIDSVFIDVVVPKTGSWPKMIRTTMAVSGLWPEFLEEDTRVFVFNVDEKSLTMVFISSTRGSSAKGCTDKMTQSRDAFVRYLAQDRCSAPTCLRDTPILALKKCAKCMMARYCSKACQETDWEEHRRICGECAEIRRLATTDLDVLMRS